MKCDQSKKLIEIFVRLHTRNSIKLAASLQLFSESGTVVAASSVTRVARFEWRELLVECSVALAD